MSNLKDTFHKLKTSILGTKTVDIDTKLNQAVKDISSYRSNSGRNGYIDLVRSLITKSTGGDLSLDNAGGMFGQGATSPATFGQGGRTLRYKSYEAIISNINYCFRALHVLTDNILSPDDITKISLDIKPTTLLGTEEVPTESKISAIKEGLKILKIEENLDIIVKNTLLFGDFFCEIASAQTALTSKALLIEHFEEAIRIGSKEILNVNEDKVKIKIVMDYSLFHENIDSRERDNLDTKNEKNDENKIDVKNLQLLFHEPNRVVKLQSDLFPLCFGYLVFPKTVLNPNYMMQDQVVNSICTSILKSLEKRIPQISEYTNNDDLKRLIATMVKETDESKALNIRYVPPDRIQHFMVPSTKYYPYGESIFDSCQFTAKVLIALETALAIQRLSRSTEKRKIGIEIGLPRDARKMVEKLKEEFRKRKISLDSFGTIDTIPSLISTFEDVYIPQKDGKSFVDIGTFSEGNVDIRGKVDELKFLRDSVIASLGIPASFLNIEENLCLLSTTYIPLLNGVKLQLSEIIDQFNKGVDDMYVYSYDHTTGKIVPDKIKWAGYTKLQTEIIRVHLDNEKYVDCTPEHPFMLRDGTYVEAQKLKVNDSLMPFYTKNTNTTTSNKISYELLYHPGLENKNWQLTYQMVANNFDMKFGKGFVIHHRDYNPRNNHPDNLWSITMHEHHSIHGSDKVRHTPSGTLYVNNNCVICKKQFTRAFNINQTTCGSKKCRKERKRLDGIKSYELRKKKNGNKLRPDLTCFICGQPTKWTKVEISDKSYEQAKQKCLSCNDPKCKSRIRAVSILTKKGTKLTCEIDYKPCAICDTTMIFSEDKTTYIDVCSLKCMNTVLARRGAEKKKQLAATIVKCRICKKDFEVPNWVANATKTHRCPECKNPKLIPNDMKFGELQKALNHKVTKIEILEGLHDTGDIRVEKYHNFALDAGIIVHNSNKNALGEESVLFARTIVAHQKYFTKNINGLIKKIFDIINPEMALTLFDHVLIALPPPKSLQFERESKYIGDLATLVEALERLGIPKEWAISKYLTNIDWGELKNFEINDVIDKKLGTAKKEDEGMGGMGGGGMGPGF